MHCVQQKLLGQPRPRVTHSLQEHRLASLHPAGQTPRNKVTVFQLLNVCLRKTASTGRERNDGRKHHTPRSELAKPSKPGRLLTLNPSLGRAGLGESLMAGKVGQKQTPKAHGCFCKVSGDAIHFQCREHMKQFGSSL